jgi:DDE superfamily endonuclease
VKGGKKKGVKVPEGRTARQEMVLSPRDRTARPITEMVLSPLARTARPGMVLSPPVLTTPQFRWKREWQERHGAVDGIAPASSLFDFHCLLCRKDYRIGNKGYSSVTQHLFTDSHQKKRIRACDQLKEKILLLLEESADGLSYDTLIRLNAPNEELPLSDGMRGWALSILIDDGEVIAYHESPFVIEQHHNAQNDRTWAEKGNPPPKEERTVERAMKPAGVMVWAAVGYNFKSKLYIIRKGLRIATPDYLKVMKLFEADCKQKIGYTEEGWARPWTFQQDGARAHTSNESQSWLLDHFPDIIARQQWPALSPDINPIELIWGILKPRVNAEAHPDVESLKRALNREWGLLSQEEINNTIDGWPGRLDAMIKAKGGRFE